MIAALSLLLFLNSFLMFTLELFYARMILPVFGSTPAVWNTCMMFYQVVLLAGYAFAYWVVKSKLILRVQFGVYAVLFLLSLLFIPISMSPERWVNPDVNPVIVMSVLLLSSIGLPFLLLSTTSTLVQVWFSRTSHKRAGDPYFLYSAGNIGSFTALALYPFVIEPVMRLGQQNIAWSVLYIGMAVLIMFSVWLLSKYSTRSGSVNLTEASDKYDGEDTGSTQKLTWFGLAFIPSSLMLGVTAYVSTDISPVPLVWVVPLGLYLLTMAAAFAGKVNINRIVSSLAELRLFANNIISWMVPVTVIVLLIVAVKALETLVLWTLVMHLCIFFVIALYCHGKLADSRPGTDKLTEFYLIIAAGGAMGGVFNSILGPVLFNSVVEYPLTMVLTFLFIPGKKGGKAYKFGWGDIVIPLCFGIAAYLPLVLNKTVLHGLQRIDLRVFIVALLAVSILFYYRRVRFTLCLISLVLVGSYYPIKTGVLLYQNRSFFGVNKVTDFPSAGYRMLYNGRTIHGAQWVNRGDKDKTPLVYYHPNGPLGRLFYEVNKQQSGKNAKVAVVGMGTGSMIAYGTPAQEWVFYEIDPVVIKIAEDKRYFTYLSNAEPEYRVVTGDARLKLVTAKNGEYDIIVIDAFSSDSVPVHLVTREAVKLYFSKLKPAGMVVFHISNRYLDLIKPISGIAAADGYNAYEAVDYIDDYPEIKYSSNWAMVTRPGNSLAAMIEPGLWKKKVNSLNRNARVWSDDYCNIWSIVKR
ncbi:MAG: fused MFS/spermidine synthase [Elusimicrobiota bacterium]